MRDEQKLKSDLTILLENAFNFVQRGSPVMLAVYEALDSISIQLSEELVDTFNQIRSRLNIGEELLNILSDSHVFQNPNFQLEKNLLEQAYNNPIQIRQIWLDWMAGAGLFKFEDSSLIRFLNVLPSK